jgi:hypothetical protein
VHRPELLSPSHFGGDAPSPRGVRADPPGDREEERPQRAGRRGAESPGPAQEEDEEILDEVAGVLAMAPALQERAEGGADPERLVDHGSRRRSGDLLRRAAHERVMSHGGVA